MLEELKQRQYLPVALVRDEARAEGSAFDGCAVVVGDVLQPSSLPTACEGALVIICCLASR